LQEEVAKEVGPYLPASEHEETLYSNLLEIKCFPLSIYSASTSYRAPEEIFDWAKDQELNLPSGWLLTEKMIRSVHDLREEPWIQLCDRGSVEEFDIDEWADSEDPDVQREFVRLMNRVLRFDMRIRHIWYSKEERCYYFPAGRNENGDIFPRRYYYRSMKNDTSRKVVIIKRQHETKEIFYCRHNAMKHSFLKIHGKWYLAITPHYIYTTDGKTTYRYAEDLLSGIKKQERPSAVLGQTIMWEYILTHYKPTLFDSDVKEEPLITFGRTLNVKCERGLDDQSWRRDDVLFKNDMDSWGLF